MVLCHVAFRVNQRLIEVTFCSFSELFFYRLVNFLVIYLGNIIVLSVNSFFERFFFVFDFCYL